MIPTCVQPMPTYKQLEVEVQDIACILCVPNRLYQNVDTTVGRTC